MNAAELEKRLLYRDGLMLVIDKPAGLPVHAGPGGGDNLERHLNWLRFGLPKPPSLAHRLDRDTSGCLVLGRHPKALRKLGKLFQDGKVEKTYWAVTRHAPAETRGQIDAPLKKLSTRSGGWHMAIAEDGQHAVTDWRVLGTSPDGLCWIECHPRTGRTHQIRVHLASLGAPLLGDAQYGDAAQEKPLTLHLQSHAISLPLYPSREPVTVSAEPPSHMQAALQTCGWVKEPPKASAQA
ncbi:RluA family pseudouridine synthase [Ferrovibrio sp.]|uniref:RluA family pseudouridine synthase n=1 Tax=Ferrovibrio sp. TaxID=1917215 RepID=UPI000CC17BFD|nr:RNA pseudouridine synthase [Ferrovibrio sp.]PJI38711.1 MAG: RNA pseudouridine synthase [Ferrovibrio sp.]